MRHGGAQGAIADRENERLGVSDRGVIMFRKLLMDQMKIVQDGGDPINVYRDPATNERIDLPVNVGPGPITRSAFTERDDHRMTEVEKGDVTAVVGEDAAFQFAPLPHGQIQPRAQPDTGDLPAL